MSWNSFWKGVGNGIKDGVSYAWDKVSDGAQYVGGKIGDFFGYVADEYNENPWLTLGVNLLTGNVPGLLNQGVNGIGHAIGGSSWDNSNLAKVMTSTLTGNIPGIAHDTTKAVQAWTADNDDDEYTPPASESIEKPTEEENKATVDKIGEQVANKVQDSDNTANLNQGDTQAEAAFKADLNVADTQGQIETGVRNAVANADTQSQADYLAKLGQAEKLDLMAENLQKGKTAQVVNAVFSGMSDVRLKDIVGDTPLVEAVETVKELTLDYTDEEIVTQLASIDTIDYTYKPGVADQDAHVGVSAQSLYNVPIFKQSIVDDGQYLQVDIIKASKVLYEIAIPALERYIGKHPVSLIRNDEEEQIDMDHLWKLLESNINLAANIAKAILKVPDGTFTHATKEAMGQPAPVTPPTQENITDVDFANSIPAPTATGQQTTLQNQSAMPSTSDYVNDQYQQVAVQGGY